MLPFDRRQFGIAATAALAVSGLLASDARTDARVPFTGPGSLFPLPGKPVPVAVLIDEGATIIDFGGPWEAFQDVEPAAGVPGFTMYTVASTQAPIRSQGGLHIIPDFIYADAPRPRVVLIPAEQEGARPDKLAWICEMAKTADIVMSVCSGAFILANTGLLDGLAATTHHLQCDDFERRYPAIRLIRGRRFVDNGKFVTAGGLTSSIDGALHVVSRFYGQDAAERTAARMEHDGNGWRSGVRADQGTMRS